MTTNAAQARHPEFKHLALVFVVLFIVWLLLAGSLKLDEIVAGFVVSLLVTLISRPHLNIFSGVRLSRPAPLHLLAYSGFFSVALLKANIDMARRVLSPSLPVRPALVEVRTELKSALGRLLLANSITLTPGTLAVDVRDNIILVHWIDCPPGTDLEAATRKIVSGFERHLRGFLI